jgi:hypothetical protein
MSGGSIWASLECQCCFRKAGGLVSYLTMWLLTFQLFKSSIETQENLRLNLHSLSVSELLEYGRKHVPERCIVTDYEWYYTTVQLGTVVIVTLPVLNCSHERSCKYISVTLGGNKRCKINIFLTTTHEKWNKCMVLRFLSIRVWVYKVPFYMH